MIETRAAVAAVAGIAARRRLPLHRDQRPDPESSATTASRAAPRATHTRACWPRSPPPCARPRRAGRVSRCAGGRLGPGHVPLLVGLGVDELSVGAARVGATRARGPALDAGTAALRSARRALQAPDAVAVEALSVRPATQLLSAVDGLRPVVAVGTSRNGGARLGAEREHGEQALGVGLAFAGATVMRALKPSAARTKCGRRPRVQVDAGGDHGRRPQSLLAPGLP